MNRVFVAGATGYLGRFVVRELRNQGYFVRALVRDLKRLARMSDFADEIYLGEVTRPETLRGICDGMGAVISSLGISRQKDGLTHEDVDSGAGPDVSEIKVGGRLDEKWSDWFENLAITCMSDDTTLLSGPVVDDCALYGLLKKIRDLNLPLLSVNNVEPRVRRKRRR